jgi:hypothetical protein
MSRVGFEPMIPAFERAKTVHALDRAATVIGQRQLNRVLLECFKDRPLLLLLLFLVG